MDLDAAAALEADELATAAAAAGCRLRVLADAAALYADFAASVVGAVRAAGDGPCRLIVPVGPRGQYPVFVAAALQARLDLRRLWLFAMDEYLDWQGRALAPGHPLSFRGYLEAQLAPLEGPCGFSCAKQLVFPDPLALEAYAARIAEVGGIDTCFGGVGIHGHVAFNEPPSGLQTLSPEAFAASTTRVVTLRPETVVMNSIRANGGDLAAFPPQAVTAGMAQILAADTIRLYLDGGAWQRSVLRRALFGPPEAAWPVTLLRDHRDLALITDRATAAACRPAGGQPS